MVKISINKFIRILTITDVLMLSGWGLVNPIFAVFVTDQVKGGSIETAGLAVTVFLLTKSVFQIPIAWYIDKKRGEKDDFWAMIIGSSIISLCAFLYIFANSAPQVVAIQALYGLGGAMSYPAWMAIFTRHVDIHKEGLEWSIYYTLVDLGAALAAGVGGLIASILGFQSLFLITGIFSCFGTTLQVVLYRHMRSL
jgi:MFS family permease